MNPSITGILATHIQGLRFLPELIASRYLLVSALPILVRGGVRDVRGAGVFEPERGRCRARYALILEVAVLGGGAAALSSAVVLVTYQALAYFRAGRLLAH
ncbi:hypothetical protein [Nocardia sp. NBC_00403]|uniref:hypothetical protein n=1 Tax=Nocardia sp. NBC_00403 TaxID=2975990 RepID=UPI002E217F43